MSGPKILAIDDSATIRRLVDTHLSSAGYQVILAATAEDGLKLAEEMQPDMILLDHQLPGTTGYEVCLRLTESPDTSRIPVVISSTLRKRAYVEYAELSNVVDMLPKPYTAELLKTTVANALDTGSLVVESQEQGTAVPEVIDVLGEPDLSGSFTHFRVREVLDFLNNNEKRGVLEVEAEYRRTSICLDGGRIVGITATGVDPDELIKRLPSSLQSLGPVVNLTIGNRSADEVHGLVELLDRKVLDPRLLRKLLRQQAAILIFDCFAQDLREFRFHAGGELPQLQQKLPLEVSLLALLIEGTLLCGVAGEPAESDAQLYTRRTIRGQNLDRAGVSAQHMKLLSLLAEPRSVEDLVSHLDLNEEEVRCVLHGLTLAEAITKQPKSQMRQVVAYDADAERALQLREILESRPGQYSARVVKDRLALQMILKRARPDAFVFGWDDDESARLCRELVGSKKEALLQAKWIALVPQDRQQEMCADWSAEFKRDLDATIVRPCRPEQLLATLDQLLGPVDGESDAPQHGLAAPAEHDVSTVEKAKNSQQGEHVFTIDA